MQLLNIRTIPIELELKISNAKLEYEPQKPRVNMNISKSGDGEFQIKSDTIKVNIDQTRFFSSIGIKKPQDFADHNAEKGKRAYYEVMSAYAKEGQIYLDIHLHDDPSRDIAISRINKNTDRMVNIVNTPSAELTTTEPSFSLSFDPKELNFDWDINTQRFSFVPGSIEFIVKSYPKVIIEYIGERIYFPPSANPEILLDTQI